MKLLKNIGLLVRKLITVLKTWLFWLECAKNLCMCNPVMETNLIYPLIDLTDMKLSFEPLKFLEVSINRYL
jgi:hypothetical protein